MLSSCRVNNILLAEITSGRFSGEIDCLSTIKLKDKLVEMNLYVTVHEQCSITVHSHLHSKTFSSIIDGFLNYQYLKLAFKQKNLAVEWSLMHLPFCTLLCFQFSCEVLGTFPCHAAEVWLLCVEASH